MITTIKKTGNGVNKDLLPSELLPGQWSDCLNVRFRNDFAEKFRGIQQGYSTPLVAPYWLQTYISATTRYAFYSGLARAFVDDGVTRTEVTRFGDGVGIASITFVGTAATLTVAAPHGRTTGDTVNVYLAAPNSYNGTFVITVSASLATPVNSLFSTLPAGGTLAAGTYWYRVSAFNSVGETLASTETSQITVGATSTVTVNWGAVAGATGYKIYGRTTGAELFIASVGAVTTYTDTGAIVPAGALPVTNKSSPGFTYTMLTTPATNATLTGAYSTNTTSNFTGARDDQITGGVLNGVLVMNNPVNGLYYWGGDIATKLRKVPNYTNIADAARPFKNYIVFLGSTVSGVKKPHNVAWSKAAEPGAIPVEFVSTPTNDAGNVDLAETPGQMVDCMPLGNVNIIYKQDSRYSMQYVGGNDVFAFQRLPGNDGLLSRGCVVNTPKGHVFLSNGDVKVHNGGDATSIADGRIRKWLFDTMDSANAQRSFLCLNPQKTEVWVCFPSYGQADCDTVAAWNWESDTWGIRTAPAITCAATGLLSSALTVGSWAADTDSWESDITTWSENEYSPNESRLILGTSAPLMGLAETGTTDFGATLSWMLEKQGIQLDDPDSIKVFSASRPQFAAVAGTQVQIQHGSAMTADGNPVYTAPVTYTVGTDNWANAFSQGGRYLAYKLSSSSLQPVALRSYDIDFTKGGRF